MVTEYAKSGDLKNFMRTGDFTYRLAWDSQHFFQLNEYIIYNITRGLKLIHNSGLVHCDLHTGNILTRNTTRKDSIGISDFGLSQPANVSSSTKFSGIYGVIPFIAPELFLGKPYTPYTPATDIYSLGIIIWALHSFEQPYNDRPHDANLILDIIRGLRPEISPNMAMTDFCMDLMKKCWDPNPENRPTAQEIMKSFDVCEENRKNNYTTTERMIHSVNLTCKMNYLLKLMKPNVRHPGTCYTSRFLSFQRVKDHLAKLTLEDSGQNDLSLPTSINKNEDFSDKIIALPTLPDTSLPEVGFENKDQGFG